MDKKKVEVRELKGKNNDPVDVGNFPQSKEKEITEQKMKVNINVDQGNNVYFDSPETTLVFNQMSGKSVLNCLQCLTHKISLLSIDDDNLTDIYYWKMIHFLLPQTRKKNFFFNVFV